MMRGGVMIDISDAGFQFRGAPVTLLGEQAGRHLLGQVLVRAGPRTLRDVVGGELQRGWSGRHGRAGMNSPRATRRPGVGLGGLLAPIRAATAGGLMQYFTAKCSGGHIRYVLAWAAPPGPADRRCSGTVPGRRGCVPLNRGCFGSSRAPADGRAACCVACCRVRRGTSGGIRMVQF